MSTEKSIMEKIPKKMAEYISEQIFEGNDISIFFDFETNDLNVVITFSDLQWLVLLQWNEGCEDFQLVNLPKATLKSLNECMKPLLEN